MWRNVHATQHDLFFSNHMFSSPADKCQNKSTALYDKSVKLGMLILDIMENILKTWGNRNMLCVSQKRVVKVVGVIIQNGHRQRYLFGVETYSIIV